MSLRSTLSTRLVEVIHLLQNAVAADIDTIVGFVAFVGDTCMYLQQRVLLPKLFLHTPKVVVIPPKAMNEKNCVVGHRVFVFCLRRAWHLNKCELVGGRAPFSGSGAA
jgi:hypothetical protein